MDENFDEETVDRWRTSRCAIKEWDSKDVRCCLLSLVCPSLKEKLLDVEIQNFACFTGLQLLFLKREHFHQRDPVYGDLLYEKFEQIRRLAAPKSSGKKPKLGAWMYSLLTDTNRYYQPHVVEWLDEENKIFKINNLRAIAFMWDVDEVKNFQRIMRNRSYNAKWTSKKSMAISMGENGTTTGESTDSVEPANAGRSNSQYQVGDRRTKDFRKLFDENGIEIHNVWQFIERQTISEIESAHLGPAIFPRHLTTGSAGAIQSAPKRRHSSIEMPERVPPSIMAKRFSLPTTTETSQTNIQKGHSSTASNSSNLDMAALDINGNPTLTGKRAPPTVVGSNFSPFAHILGPPYDRAAAALLLQQQVKSIPTKSIAKRIAPIQEVKHELDDNNNVSDDDGEPQVLDLRIRKNRTDS